MLVVLVDHEYSPSTNPGQSSILQSLVCYVPEASHGRIVHDMNIIFVSSTTATPIVTSSPNAQKLSTNFSRLPHNLFKTFSRTPNIFPSFAKSSTVF